MPSPRSHGIRASTWWGTNVPTTGPTTTTTTWVCVKFRLTIPGRLAGIRFYDGFAAGSAVYGTILDDTLGPSQYVGFGTYRWPTGGSSAAWRQAWFRPWKRVVVGHDYFVCVLYVGGQFYRNNAALASSVTRNGIQFVFSFQTTSLDLTTATVISNTNANAVDVLFYPD